MAKRKTSGFGTAMAEAGAAVDERPSDDPSNNVLGQVEQRQVVQERIAKTDRRPRLWLEPEDCVLWEFHNREYDLLTEEDCKGLIEDFISAGQQEVPAIVRKRADGKYEIVAGARRFWVVNWLRNNNYPDFKFLAEVRSDLTDEAAFRASNVENLSREDISAYERGMDYAQAIDLYYGGKQSALAQRIGKSDAWVSEQLKVAKIPREIVDCFNKLRDLKTHHAPIILGAMKSASEREKVLAEAEKLRSEQSERRSIGLAPIKADEILKRLVKPRNKRGRAKGGSFKSYGPQDKPRLQVRAVSKQGVTLFVPNNSEASIAQIKKDLGEALEEYGKI